MDMAYEELMMREKETTEMCVVCERGITFEPDDLVIRTFRTAEWDDEKEMMLQFDARQVGKVLEVSQEHGTVLVLWGTDKDKEIEREWCWPSDFVARIRNGKYETIRELWGV